MAHGDERGRNVLVEDRPSGPQRGTPNTDRWWLLEPPSRVSRTRRGPAHPPTRSQTHSDGVPLGHLFEPVIPVVGLSWPDRAVESDGYRPPPGLPQQSPYATPAGGWQVPAAHSPSSQAAPPYASPTARPHVTPTDRPYVSPAARSSAPLPRRRDLRAGRAQAPAPVVSTPPRGFDQADAFGTGYSRRAPGLPAPAPGLPFAPDPYATGADVLDLGTGPLPRRRDLRRAEQGDRGSRAARQRRKSALAGVTRAGTATAVARGAVLTGLVAVGVATITGQGLELDGLPDAGSGSATAGLALPPAGSTAQAAAYEVNLEGTEPAWQVGADAKVAIAKGLADVQTRQVAAKKAAAKKAAEKAAAEARVRAKAEALRNAQRNPKAIGRIMAAERGWTGSQWTCLNKLWNRESRWRFNADNPTSSAYGIPQALPGSRMRSAGADWRTNPVTQIEWGLDYIADRYGSPCNAWAHSERTGWY